MSKLVRLFIWLDEELRKKFHKKTFMNDTTMKAEIIKFIKDYNKK